MRFASPMLVLSFAAAPVAANDFSLALPIDCSLGRSCFIQQYPDADPGPGATDYTCGPLSYDRHSGTDFALPSLAAFEAGVDVYAVAPGTVTGRRDGMADQLQNSETPPDISNRACGNGVVLRHEDGWETQYCHLKRGSIRVETGQQVDSDTVLGQVGLSGRTEFPHLHLTLRKDGRVVDPFNADEGASCGQTSRVSLWQDAPAYRPGGLIATGFADDIPSYDAVKAGTAAATTLSRTASALAVWVYAFGGQEGDALQVDITGPSGRILSQAVTLEKDQAQYFRAIGRRAPDGGWPAGQYTGKVTVLRAGETLETGRTTVTVTP